jgi:hypothetical protein
MGGNILPKREGQVFFGAPMDPFTCGMRTFLSCGRTGAHTNDGEEDGMYLLFKDGLESGNEEDRNSKKKQVKDFVTYLVQEGMKQTDIDNEETTHVTVDCSLRQSRFCTLSKEQTAPLVEMTYKQHEEMEAEGGLCVHALVPLSKDGLFVRFFYNKDDRQGTIIKVMPTTILMYPSTAIMEYGRVTNIDGHRHLLVKMLYTKNKDVPAVDLGAAVREYPHLEATVKAMQDPETGELPDNWEHGFRHVTYPALEDNPKGKENILKFLESKASKDLDELCAH